MEGLEIASSGGKWSEKGEDGGTEPGEKVEYLLWEGMKEKIDHLF